MKAKDLIHMLCKHQAIQAAADVNLILEPGEEPSEFTEEYTRDFYNQLTSKAQIQTSRGHIIIFKGEEAPSNEIEHLEAEVEQGHWVYLALQTKTEDVIHTFQRMGNDIDAHQFYIHMKSSGLFEWMALIDAKQGKVEMEHTALEASEEN